MRGACKPARIRVLAWPSVASLPERISRLDELAHDLSWSWTPEARTVFRQLDYASWRRTAHNPVQMLQTITPKILARALASPTWLAAYDAKTGDERWRWYVTPQKAGDPGLETWPNLDMAIHGGGMTWQPITYDPELNIIYVTTGYRMIALNAKNGAFLWRTQTGGQMASAPMSYAVDGHQFVAVTVGSVLYSYALTE